MNHQLICSWLGLPSDCWPPDHYRLLGLEPGESDTSLIEQRVHQRLDSVRRYQMVHPEQATEAMNRLAQAFVCLTEPAAKRAYDLSIGSVRPRPSPPPLPVAPPPPPPVPVQTKPEPRDAFVWLYTAGVPGPGQDVPPPPVRVAPPPPPAPPPAVREEPPPEPPAPPIPPPAPAAPVDPILAAAWSPGTQKGIATRRGLYRRVAHTRELLRLWRKMGQYLSDANRKMSKPESADLVKLVERVAEEVEEFPLLGEAGQPGYLIVSLTTLDRARELRDLMPSQRESLERDWKGGKRFLEAHRDGLRRELKEYRKRTRRDRMLRAVRGYLNEQPLCAMLVLLSLVAVGVAVYRTWWAG